MNSYSKNTSGISSLQDGMGQLSVTDKENANTLNTFFSSVFTQEKSNVYVSLCLQCYVQKAGRVAVRSAGRSVLA